MSQKDRNLLTVNESLELVRIAIMKRKPFSLVRVGDGENIVLAQQSAMTIEQVLETKWAKQANKGQKGVYLPYLKLRDEMVYAINKADLVVIPFWEKDPIIADQSLK